jgi:predicted dehydrogenase
MANKPIKVGLIGLGFIGKVHANAYNAIPFRYKKPVTHAEVKAVLRTKTDTDEDFLRALGSPFVTSDSDAFFDQELDLVDICTPNVLHLEQAKASLEHNLHLYIEKPLGWNLKHAQEIAEAANSSGVLTHTAFMRRYYPAVRQARAIIASGVLGEIYSFRVHYYHKSYMDPNRPTSWRLQHAMAGGGALTDLGVHIIDMTRYLLGEAEWVQCRTKTFIKKRPKIVSSSEMVPVDVDDWGICTVGLENGAYGTIEATRMSGGVGDSTRMEIFARNGSVVIDLKDPLHCEYYDQSTKKHSSGNLDFPAPRGEREISTLWPNTKVPLDPFDSAHTALIYDFLQCIQEGRQSMLNFNDAVKTQEILEAAYKSAGQNGKTINLPLEYKEGS